MSDQPHDRSPATSQRAGNERGSKLRITRWTEGNGAIQPRIIEFDNGGGWSSVAEMQRVRLADYKKNPRPFTVSKIEFGYRADEQMTGPLQGMTQVEVVEFLRAEA